MANPVGNLLVRIGADTGGLRRGGRRAETTMQRMGRQARATATRVARLGAAAAAAGAALTTYLTRQGLQAVDAQAKLARQLGGTIDGLRGLQLAANDAGVDTNTLNQSMERLSQRIGEARRGTGQAAQAFERLGINADEMARMDVDQRAAHIADRMRDLGLSTDQAADELRQMGIRNAEVVNLLREGGGAIRDATEEIDALGLSLSDVDAAQVEAANDAMSRMGSAVELIQQALAVELAPILEGIADLFLDSQKESNALRDAVESFVDFGIRGFAFVADAVESLRRTFTLAREGIATFAFTIQREMLRATDTILSGPVDAINTLIRLANRIPGIDFGMVDQPEIVEDLRGQMEAASLAVEEGKAAMHETLTEPMPSEGIHQWVDDVREASERAAIETVEGRERMAEAQAQADEEERERRLENNEHLREILGDHLNLETDMIRDAQERMTEIEEQGAEARKRAAEAEARQKQRIMGDALQDLTTLMNSESREMFKIGKAAAISQSLISTYQGMSKALELGWPLGPIAASAIGAAGFANVQSIKSQSFGGGGSGGGASSNTQQVNANATPTGQDGGGQAVERSITIRGEGVSQEWIRESLAPALNEAAGDGVRFAG